MTRCIRGALCVLTFSAFLLTITQGTANAQFKPFRFLWPKVESTHEQPPQTALDPCIEKLASEIDWLEGHIDAYGTIVAKHPDVWGEARLTKHRDEFERIMRAELGGFETRLSATVAQADQAYAVTAIALSAALDDSSTSTPQSATASATNLIATLDGGGGKLNLSERVEGQGAFAKDRFANFPNGGSIDISPVDYLDQLKRYQGHLNQIRRENEGDDTSDSPGYSMNLVRIPVSVLPGKHTRRGYGAEITITAEPYLSHNLLCNTYRDLVVNDLVDQLSLPILKISEAIKDIDAEKAELEKVVVDARSKLAAIKIFEDEAKAHSQTLQEILDAVKKSDNATAVAKLAEARKQAKVINQRHAEVRELGQLCAMYVTLLQHFTIKKGDVDASWSRQVAVVALRIQELVGKVAPHSASLEKYKTWRTLKAIATNAKIVNALKNIQASLVSPDPEAVVPFVAELNKVLATLLFNEGVEENAKVNMKAKPLVPANFFVPQYRKLNDSPVTDEEYQSIAENLKGKATQLEDLAKLAKTVNSQLDAAGAAVAKAATALSATQSTLGKVGLPPANSRARRALHPLPPSQVLGAFGAKELEQIARVFMKSYSGRYVRWNGGGAANARTKLKADSEQRVHLLDVRRFLQAEVEAAYDLLAQPEHVPMLVQFVETHPATNTSLASDLRSRHGAAVDFKRSEFLKLIHQHDQRAIHGAQVFRRQRTIRTVGHTGTPGIETRDDGMGPITEGEKIPPAAVNAAGAQPYIVQGAALPLNLQPQATYPQATYSQATYPQAEPQPLTVTEYLAWTVIVESALLNERLHADVRAAAVSKGCGCYEGGARLKYYLPETTHAPESPFHADYQQAAESFIEYVKCRWPIQVFAIDPVTQDQNVADIASRRREMQLALSLAFTSRRMNLESFTRLSRKLDTDIETIRLNRIVHGFSHGNDTFGWRFSPRVQTPPAPTTLQALGESVWGATRDCDTNQLSLEPGVRECVAVVLMPSFVPYCDFDVRSRWYQLTNPKNTAVSMRQTMQLSRAIRSMKDSSDQARHCEHLYRLGEVDRLLKRVHQLDRELPLQTMRAQIPYENTLGGFEMFNTGVTDLAPEFIGWYGAPGVLVTKPGADSQVTCTSTAGTPATATAIETREKALLEQRINAVAQLAACPCKGTTLFLVGDNFSVHDTRVIAGGLCIPDSRLISREIIQVTIPSTVQTVTIDGNKYVDIHLATPYGVTNHLHVPVVQSAEEKAAAELAAVVKKVDALDVPKLKWTTEEIVLAFRYDNNQDVRGCYIAPFALTREPALAVVESPDAVKFLNVLRQGKIVLKAPVVAGGPLANPNAWAQIGGITQFMNGAGTVNKEAFAQAIRDLIELQPRPDGLNASKNGGKSEITFEVEAHIAMDGDPRPRAVTNKLKVRLTRETLFRLPQCNAPQQHAPHPVQHYPVHPHAAQQYHVPPHQHYHVPPHYHHNVAPHVHPQPQVPPTAPQPARQSPPSTPEPDPKAATQPMPPVPTTPAAYPLPGPNRSGARYYPPASGGGSAIRFARGS